MKRILALVCVVIMLSGLLLLTLPASDNGGPDTSHYGEGDDGSNDGTLWWKTSRPCPNDQTKTEYSCTAGGLDQCKVQNCP